MFPAENEEIKRQEKRRREVCVTAGANYTMLFREGESSIELIAKTKLVIRQSTERITKSGMNELASRRLLSERFYANWLNEKRMR